VTSSVAEYTVVTLADKPDPADAATCVGRGYDDS